MRHTLARRDRLSRDMAVHPFHRIGSGERQASREHLVQRHAERVEIAAGVDRTIHPPGLLRRHIGERTGDRLGRPGPLALSRKPRCKAETCKPDFTAIGIHQDVGRLDIPVHEPALVDFGQRRRDADSEDEEGLQVQRCIEETVEGLVAGIFGTDDCFVARAEPRSAVHIGFDLVHGMPVGSGACPSRERRDDCRNGIRE